MTSFTDLRMGLLRLGLSHTAVIAHASLSAFGEVVGGAETLLRATLDSVWALVMPTFTYQTMITPAEGPAQNGMLYRGNGDIDAQVEPFTPGLPADKMMGAMSEASPSPGAAGSCCSTGRCCVKYARKPSYKTPNCSWLCRLDDR